MDSTNTRRWPRYHVHLPVLIAPSPGATDQAVNGLVCELSRAGMELYAGLNLQPGDVMEVEFQTSSRLRIAGIVRYRSGFCYGLEFCAPQAEPQPAPQAAPEPTSDSEAIILARREAQLRELHQKINQSLQAVLEMRKRRGDRSLR
jgi:hypothetical protein